MKRTLAHRAGYRCSNPSCLASTAAGQERAGGLVNLGVAAHITSAAPNGPRYDPDLTPEKRRDIANGLWLCQNCAKLIDSDVYRFSVPLLTKWRADAEYEAFRRLGVPERALPVEAPTAEEIQRALSMRDQLRSGLLKTPEELRRSPRTSHPYSRFKDGHVVVHAMDDRLYPEIDPLRSPSGWFRAETYDFYHGGLLVITWLTSGAVDADGYWSILGHDEPFDEARFKRIKIWHLGEIPFRHIQVVDWDGDEFYTSPHIYCTYTPEMGPYEGVRYMRLGEDMDWPLEPTKRLPPEEARPRDAA